MRLETIDPTAIKENNPTILRRLTGEGVVISADEITTIDALRNLRNKLQHAGASFGYRDTRRLLRAAFILLDRFAIEELDLWISHVCDLEGWRSLLMIAPIEANAEKISAHMIVRAASEPTIKAIVSCEGCGRERMVVFDTGFRNCLYCHEEHHPKVEDDFEDIVPLSTTRGTPESTMDAAGAEDVKRA